MSAPRDRECIFCRIVSGEIPAKKCYEDGEVLAFHDIAPQAPVHVLIIPKRHLPNLDADAGESLLGGMLVVAARLAGELGIRESGFRVVINSGANAGQAVAHLHIHLFGGRKMNWPPG